MNILEQHLERDLAELGARIRTLRSDRGWTQDELSGRTGLSKSYLSRLEEGGRQPSIASLLSLARAFHVSMNELFGTESDPGRCGIVRAGADPLRQGNGLYYRPLLPADRASTLQPIHVTIPIDRSGDELYRHDGEEWLYVLAGAVRLTLDTETYDLNTGDAAHFDARMPHRLTALGQRDADVILVASAPPRQLLATYL